MAQDARLKRLGLLHLKDNPDELRKALAERHKQTQARLAAQDEAYRASKQQTPPADPGASAPR